MLKIFFSVTLLLIMSRCDSRSSSASPTVPSIRSGRSISNINPLFVDIDPSISADGQKIVFVSGRQDGVLRTFKSTWNGTGYSAPTLASSKTGMTKESYARLSPDGSWLLIQGATTSGTALSLCSYTSEVCTGLSTSPWGEGRFEFSSDSQSFFYFSGTKEEVATLFVGDVNNGSPSTSQVGSSDIWRWAIFQQGSSPYTLLTVKNSDTSGRLAITSRTFTNAAGAASATETVAFSSESYQLGFGRSSLSTTRFPVIVPIKPSASKTMPEIGNLAGIDPNDAIGVINELHTYQGSGGDDGAISANLGFAVSSAWLASDDKTLFVLNRIAPRCNGDDGNRAWGTAMALVDRTTAKTTWHFAKKTGDMDKAPTFTSDFCDNAINGTVTGIDGSIYDLAVNGNATSTSYTLVWTSDMTGDSEIFAAIVNGSTNNTYTVSANRAR